VTYCKGGNYGSGKRAGGVSALICGVLDDRDVSDNDETRYVFVSSRRLRTSKLNTPTFRYSSFVRVGSGLSFADYVWVRDKPWKVWDHKAPPSFFQTVKKASEDKGDVYLEPQEYDRCSLASSLLFTYYLVLVRSFSRSKLLKSLYLVGQQSLPCECIDLTSSLSRPVSSGFHDAFPQSPCHS